MVFEKACPPDNLPPTSAALQNHALCVLYQAGHIWGKSLLKAQNAKDPSLFGWKKDVNGVWTPFWTHHKPLTKNDINKNCGCKTTNCKGNCICKKLKMNCTTLCNCRGQCKAEQQN